MITNCAVSSSCNCIKIGTETHGDFQDIVIANCTFPPRAFQRQAQAAIAIESTDGSNIQGITITNCISRLHKCSIFIQLGNRLRAAEIGQSEPGSIKDIIISNFIAEGTIWPIILSGFPKKHIENIQISNIRLIFRSEHDINYISWHSLKDLFECEKSDAKYPDPEVFGGFPARILFMRNCSEISITNFSVCIEKFMEVPLIPLIGLYYCKNLHIAGRISERAGKVILKEMQQREESIEVFNSKNVETAITIRNLDSE